MDAARLLHWGDLDDARRRRASRGLSAVPGWAWSAACALAIAAELARELHVFGADAAGTSTARGASTLFLAAVAASHIVVLFGAPFRMFWRRDSAFLGRSAIAGRALFTVALVRSVRATAHVALPGAACAMVFAAGPHGSVDLALRQLCVVGLLALSAGLLGPAVALAAGALVTSSKAHAALGSLAGEFSAPTTTWLGTLPGVAGAGVGLLVIALAGWTRGGDTTPVGDPIIPIAIGAVLPVVALAWALARADAVLLAATREVAALDQERLAHVDLTQPGNADRIASALLRDPGARSVLGKDARLARRRYPIPFFLGVVGLVTQWIVAAVDPADAVIWAAVIHAGLGVYGVVMARRAMTTPTEHLGFLASLPIAPRAVSAAKFAHVILWVAVYMGLGAIPIAWRAADSLAAALLLGAIGAVTLAVGWRVTRVTSVAG